MAKLTDIKGIDEASAEKLKAAGATTQESFLTVCGDKKGRKEAAANTGIDEKEILGWLNRADLARIKGVSTVYADLLELAGVDTVPELAQRNGANLHAKIEECNAEQNLAEKMPTNAQVEEWVAQAKELPRAIHY
jgi:predicted flap endonuclease-1-like 5' DNA nuclease